MAIPAVHALKGHPLKPGTCLRGVMTFPEGLHHAQSAAVTAVATVDVVDMAEAAVAVVDHVVPAVLVEVEAGDTAAVVVATAVAAEAAIPVAAAACPAKAIPKAAVTNLSI
jgi:hypothetical protein